MLSRPSITSFALLVVAIAACGRVAEDGAPASTANADDSGRPVGSDNGLPPPQPVPAEHIARDASATQRECTLNSQCAENEICDLQHDCDSHGPGVCKPRPVGCIETLDDRVVCGCDGKIYPDECHANRAGVSLHTDMTRCETTASPSTFDCGTGGKIETCDAKSQFCDLETQHGQACSPLPAACQAPGATCDCFGFWMDPCVGCHPQCIAKTLPDGTTSFTLLPPAN